MRINADLGTHAGPQHFALNVSPEPLRSYSVTLVPADAMELRDELTAWLNTLPVCSALPNQTRMGHNTGAGNRKITGESMSVDVQRSG